MKPGTHVEQVKKAILYGSHRKRVIKGKCNFCDEGNLSVRQFLTCQIKAGIIFKTFSLKVIESRFLI